MTGLIGSNPCLGLILLAAMGYRLGRRRSFGYGLNRCLYKRWVTQTAAQCLTGYIRLLIPSMAKPLRKVRRDCAL